MQQCYYQPQRPLALLQWLCKETLRGRKITVTDVYGKVVIEKQLQLWERNTQMNISNIKGVYFVNITNAVTGSQKMSKIVVE